MAQPGCDFPRGSFQRVDFSKSPGARSGDAPIICQSRAKKTRESWNILSRPRFSVRDPKGALDCFQGYFSNFAWLYLGHLLAHIDQEVLVWRNCGNEILLAESGSNADQVDAQGRHVAHLTHRHAICHTNILSLCDPPLK